MDRHQYTSIGASSSYPFSKGVQSNCGYEQLAGCGVKKGDARSDGNEGSLFKVAPMGNPTSVVTVSDEVSLPKSHSVHLQRYGQAPAISKLEAGSWLGNERVEAGTCGGSRSVGTESVFETATVGEIFRLEGKGTLLSESKLFAHVRATAIKETVEPTAIQRFGGGQEGLRAPVEEILFGVPEKNRSLPHCRDVHHPSDIAPRDHELSFPFVKYVACQPPGLGSVVDGPVGSFTSCDTILLEEVNCLTNSVSGCRKSDWLSLSDSKFAAGIGGDERGPDCGENKYPSFSDKLREEVLLGALSEEVYARPSKGMSPTSTSSWNSSLNLSEVLRWSRNNSRELSFSGLNSCEGARSYPFAPNKILRCSLSPRLEGGLSSQNPGELLSFTKCSPPSPPVCEELFTSTSGNLFASTPPDLLNPLCVMTDPLSLETSTVDLRHSLVINKNLSGTTSGHAIDRLCCLGSTTLSQSSAAPVGQLAEDKATNTTSSTLARKRKMHCNKKAASHQIVTGDGDFASSKINCQSSSPRTGSVGRPIVSVQLSAGLGQQDQSLSDRKDLKYLLEKELRQSDVGSLSRIILPKKCAESHLPWLVAGTGIPFDCEDYVTGENMTLHYRFWPNNKSRMYVLERTGEFIKRHQLKPFDRMVMYRNQEDRSRKYVIRPCKAAVPTGTLLPRRRRRKESAHTSFLGNPRSSTLSPLEGSAPQSPESIVGFGFKACSSSLESVLTSSVARRQDGLSYADLNAQATDTPLRFPTLEAFDAELFLLSST